jgi:hypothetical protein
VPTHLSRHRIEEIARALRGDFARVPTMRGLVADSQRELASLSLSQYSVLDYSLHSGNPRILCDGAAGTGKTIIAMEAARRLSQEGKRVLLLCYNTQLGRFLSREKYNIDGRVTVSTVHRYMKDVIIKAGFSSTLKLFDTEGPTYFSNDIPILFEKAVESLIDEGIFELFDVIVIDEAQDVLSAPIMNSLGLVLADGFASGSWLIFLDTRVQAKLFNRMDQKVLAGLRQLKPAEFRLSENFRNPKAVITEMCQITKMDEPQCRRNIKSSVDYRPYGSTEEERKKLELILSTLESEGVLRSSITILSVVSKEKSCVIRHSISNGRNIVYLDDDDVDVPSEALTASSISAFKGLENDVIILTDVPSISPLSDWSLSALYVGMTRARSKLFMLVDEAYIDARTN